MDFSVQISVPIEEDGWEGVDHLPTLRIYAPTEKDAEGRLEDIVKHMPDGTTYYMVEI